MSKSLDFSAEKPRFLAVHKVSLIVVNFHNPDGNYSDWYVPHKQRFFEEQARLSQSAVSKGFKELLKINKGQRASRTYFSFFREKRVDALYAIAVNRLLEVGLDYRDQAQGSKKADCDQMLLRKSLAEYRDRRLNPEFDAE